MEGDLRNKSSQPLNRWGNDDDDQALDSNFEKMTDQKENKPPEEDGDEEDGPSKTKKPRRKPFHEDNLVSENGLKKIYEKFPDQLRSAAHHGNEGKALKQCLMQYKEWGRALYPALAFEDLVDRIEDKAKKAAAQALMSELREKEAQRENRIDPLN